MKTAKTIFENIIRASLVINILFVGMFFTADFEASTFSSIMFVLGGSVLMTSLNYFVLSHLPKKMTYRICGLDILKKYGIDVDEE